MFEVKDMKGKRTKDPKHILKLQAEFYGNLYKANPAVQFTVDTQAEKCKCIDAEE